MLYGCLPTRAVRPAVQSSLLKHGINGYLYCNMPRPEVRAGERVRLHGLAVGGTEDGHALWLGGAALRQAAAGQQAADVMVLTPGGTADADVVFNTPGGFVGGQQGSGLGSGARAVLLQGIQWASGQRCCLHG